MQQKPILPMLMRAVYWFDDALEAGFEAHGIESQTRAEAFIFFNLAMGETHAIKIANNLGVSRQAIGQILDGLRKRGYVKIRPDPANRRARIVSLTPSSAKTAEICEIVLKKAELELGRRIGKKLAQQMRQALEANWGDPPGVPLPKTETKRK